ncbi:hypothetical protein F5Y19DRAFT_473083 [Xylariaceae sp. FL1651]|nr:hypothetical protein F5Y19DRAFT_473083 [Xylariaceae sp. FL1651]
MGHSTTWQQLGRIVSRSIDDYITLDAPASDFAAGQQMSIPVLAGWCARKHTIFQIFALAYYESNLGCVTRPFLHFCIDPAETTKDAAIFYPTNSSTTTTSSTYLLIADLIVAPQTWEAAYLQSLTVVLPPTYFYHFTYTSAFNPVAGQSTELPFLFKTFTPQPQSANPNTLTGDLPE